MEPREQRLEAILESLVKSPSGGLSRDDVYRRQVSKFGTSVRTCRDDLQALELGGFIEYRVGHVYVTARGRKKRLEGW